MFKDFTFCQFYGTCQEVVTNISKVFIYEKLTKEWNSNSNCVIGVLFHRNQKLIGEVFCYLFKVYNYLGLVFCTINLQYMH